MTTAAPRERQSRMTVFLAALIATAMGLGGCDSTNDALGPVQERLSADKDSSHGHHGPHGPKPENKFDFHIGDRFLTALDSAFPSGDVARAANGDEIRIVGHGQIDGRKGKAEGEGTFEHRDSAGALVASGDWHVKELISFTDYGTDSMLPPTFHGGTAVLRVRVHGHRQPHTTGEDPKGKDKELSATLVVDCRIGAFPTGLEEGSTVSVQGGPEFDQKVSGMTLFVKKGKH